MASLYELKKEMGLDVNILHQPIVGRRAAITWLMGGTGRTKEQCERINDFTQELADVTGKFGIKLDGIIRGKDINTGAVYFVSLDWCNEDGVYWISHTHQDGEHNEKLDQPEYYGVVLPQHLAKRGLKYMQSEKSGMAFVEKAVKFYLDAMESAEKALKEANDGE